MPFGPYKNFEDCVEKNQGKARTPEAFCAWLRNRIEGGYQEDLFYDRLDILMMLQVEDYEGVLKLSPLTSEKAKEILKHPDIVKKDSDAVILDDHRWVHMWANAIRDHKNLFISKEDVRRLHDIYVDEFARRRFDSGIHHKSPLHFSALELGTKLESMLKSRKAFLVDEEFLSAVGSSVTGKINADIDTMWATIKNPSYHNRFLETLPKSMQKDIHAVFDPSGPNGPYIPMFRLWAEPIENPTVKEPKYTIQPMSPIKPPIPENNIEDPREILEDSYFIVPMNGIRLMIHRKESQVIAYDDKLEEIDLAIEIATDLLKIEDPRTFVLDGYIARTKGAAVFYMMDMPWWRDSEHTRQTAEERRIFLLKLKESDHLKMAPTQYFPNRKEAIEYLKEEDGPLYLIPGSTIYAIDGQGDWYLYNRSKDLKLEEGADAKIKDLIDSDKWESMPGEDRFRLMTKRLRVEPLYPFAQLKTIKKGYAAHEVFGIKSVPDLAKEVFRLPNKESVEVKIDGFRVQAHKKGDEVKLFTESGHEITEQIPKIAQSLKEVHAKEVVLDSECTPYAEDLVNLGRQGAVGAFAEGAKTPADDSLWALHVFDILYMDGEQFSELPYEERRKKLHGLELPVRDIPKSKDDFRNHLWENNVYWTTSAEQMVKESEEVSKIPGSEGAMFKQADSKYRLTGSTPLWSKVKVSYEIDALVVGIIKPEKLGEGVVNYIGAIGPVDIGEAEAAPLDTVKNKKFVKWKGKIYSILGKTFNTKLKANVGGIIRVSLKWISKIEDNVYHWFQPQVVEVREDKFKPDPLEVAETIFKTAQTTSKVPGPKVGKNTAFLVKARFDEASPIVCCRADWIAIHDEKGFTYLRNKLELCSELHGLGIEAIAGTSIDHELADEYAEQGITFVKTEASTIGEYENQEPILEENEEPEQIEISISELREFYDSIRCSDIPYMKLSCGAFFPLVRILQLQDPYMIYPSEDGTWRYAIQFHIRGLSVHADFRLTTAKNKAVGWTWDNPKSLIKPMLRRTPRELRTKAGITEQDLKLPISELSKKVRSTTEGRHLMDLLSKKTQDLSFQQLKEMCEELWKEEFEPTIANPNDKIMTQTKGEMDPEWLTYEEEVPVGATGATTELEGVFVIMDNGTIEFGAQKSYYHEYFIKGKRLNGRLVSRRLPTRTEWQVKESFAWLTFFTKKTEMPYVISSRGVQKQWMPPQGISALPKTIRNQIPEEYRYWTNKNPKETRDNLVAQMKAKKVSIKLAQGLKFAVKRVWHKGPEVQRGLPVVRYWLILYSGNKVLEAFDFGQDADPLENDGLTARQSDTKGIADLIPTSGELEADHPASWTKKLKNEFDTSDEGSAQIIEDTNAVLRFKLNGKVLKGAYALVREDSQSDSWIFQKTELSEPKKAMMLASPDSCNLVHLEAEDIEVKQVGDLLIIRGPAIKPGEVLPMDGKPAFFGKEGIKKFWPSMYRQPIVVLHGDLKGDVIGFVSKNWYDEETGWGWVEGVIWHPVGIKLILEKKLPAFSIEVLPESVWDPEHKHEHVIGGTCIGLALVPKGACVTCRPLEATVGAIKVVPGKVYKFGMTIEQYLNRQYWDNGFSTQQISEEEGIPRSTIEAWMEQAGIPRRDHLEARRLRLRNEKEVKLLGGRAEITALGTGAFSDIPRDECPQCKEARAGGKSRRNFTATLFSVGNIHLLVNAPKGIAEMLSLKKVKPTYVLIEHIHEDVIGGLHELRSMKPIVFATKDSWEFLRKHYKALSGQKGEFEDLYDFKRYIINPDKAFTIGDKGQIVIGPIQVAHAKPGDPAALAFKIAIGNKVVWHCSDILDIPQKKVLKDVDLYIGDGASLTRGIKQGEDGYGHASIEEQLKWTEETNIPRVYFTQIGHVGMTHDDLNKKLHEMAPNAQALYDGEEIQLGGDNPGAVLSAKEAANLLSGEAKILVRTKPYIEYAKQAIYFIGSGKIFGLWVEGFPEGPYPAEKVQKEMKEEHRLSEEEWKKLIGNAKTVWIYRPRILKRYEPPKKISNEGITGPYIDDLKLSN